MKRLALALLLCVCATTTVMAGDWPYGTSHETFVFWFPGTPSSNQCIRIPSVDRVVLQTGLVNSVFNWRVAVVDSSYVVTLKDDAGGTGSVTTLGTLTFSTGVLNTAVVSLAQAVIQSGDILIACVQSTPDSAGTDLSLAIAARLQ